MRDPILITGCARSGTSLTSGVVFLGGAFGGKLAGPNSNNKRGMFENTEIRNGIVKPYLRKMGVDPLGQKPLPDIFQVLKHSYDAERVGRWKTKITEIMKTHGYKEGPWFYKGAKLCLIWPLWYEAFPKAKWIIVKRESKDIAASCMRTGFMRAYNSESGWMEWIETHLNRFEEMKTQKGLNVFEIWPQKMIEGDLTEIRECITKYLGMEWKEKEVLNFIAPALWSNVKRKANGSKSNYK